MTDQERKLIVSELKSFLDEDMRLTGLPAKRKKQMLGLYLIADQLPTDGEWSERELNAVLNTLHTFGDPAMIRRELFELGWLDRDPYGRRYTVRPDRPGFEEFVARGLN